MVPLPTPKQKSSNEKRANDINKQYISIVDGVLKNSYTPPELVRTVSYVPPVEFDTILSRKLSRKNLSYSTAIHDEDKIDMLLLKTNSTEKDDRVSEPTPNKVSRRRSFHLSYRDPTVMSMNDTKSSNDYSLKKRQAG